MIERPSGLDALVLRPATAADAHALFEWRNDAVTRANSRDHGVVSWDAHRTWLAAVLGDPARELLIAELAGTAVGTVRLDSGEAAIELSWTVAPAHRNQGIGRAMVALAAARRPGARLRAEIARANPASMAIARTTGFRLDDEQADMTIWLRE